MKEAQNTMQCTSKTMTTGAQQKPLFSLGQPVKVRSSRDVFLVVAWYTFEDTYAYVLKRYDGMKITRVENSVERMAPFGREKKKNGRVRTIPGYFFTIRGGLAT